MNVPTVKPAVQGAPADLRLERDRKPGSWSAFEAGHRQQESRPTAGW